MYVKAAEYSKLFKVHPQTLRRWAESGKVQFKWSPGGIRLYRLPDADRSGGEPVEEQVSGVRAAVPPGPARRQKHLPPLDLRREQQCG